MNLKKISIIFSPILLLSNEQSNIFDYYHESLCAVLVNSSNSIDDYFIEGNRTVSSKTYAKFSTSFAEESGSGMESDVRFRLRLNLPKIQKSLRLYFEDESSDDILYDGTTLNEQKLDKKRYFLRLDFFNYVKDTFDVRVGGGVRFRKDALSPYLNLRSNYKLYSSERYTTKLYDRFRKYIDGEVENSFEFNSIYTLNSNTYITFRNRLHYKSENAFTSLSNSLSIVDIFNDKQQLSYGFSLFSDVGDFHNLNVEYYDLYSSFHHLFYKDWVYYEISPSILKRERNGFDISYRLLVNFGIDFKTQ